MAKRMYFKVSQAEDVVFEEGTCDFEYNKGFSITQKQKNITALHNAILIKEPNSSILEISTKSNVDLGVNLSAFNLRLYNEYLKRTVSLENIFQSSKVFEGGGPYTDLLVVSPREAKQDMRLKNSGKLIGFYYSNTLWDTTPKTLFYDWLYINALHQNKELSQEVMSYNIFTDIEFNHNKSINCQARSAAIYVSLRKKGIIQQVLDNYKLLSTVY